MRVVLDGTPLLGPRTGIGRYTAHLIAGLARPELGLDVGVTAFSWRGLADLTAAVANLPGDGEVAPAGARGPRPRVTARRVPARLLREAWARTELPPVELLTGPMDVFHATNYVLGPLRHAAGVLSIHDLTYLRQPETVTAATARYRELVPRGLRRASAVLTLGRAVADEVVAEYRLDPALVTPVPPGVDEPWFDAKPPDAAWLAARGLPERYLLFVGSLEPRKNLPRLLDALRLLRAERRDVPPLALVGPPGWGPALDVAGLPPDAVVATGFLPDDDLRRIVAGAAVLCFPSLYEGFGLPVLEALAAGTPVVAGDVPAVRELAGPLAGTAVRLVTPTDTEDLATAIAAVLDAAGSPALAADAGRAHAREFSWSRTAELAAKVYASVG